MVANRMIFLSPVWSPDVLVQAIKRVHRIGQTRATRVQILAIAGTFEADIANRAIAQRTDDEEKLYSRAMIEVCHTDGMTRQAWVPLIHSEPTLRVH